MPEPWRPMMMPGLPGCNCHQDLVIAFALNFDAGNTGFETFGFDKVTNFFILDEVFAKIFFIGIPTYPNP